jgi:hypothetical protein
LLRDTHESSSDPEARLFRKSKAGAAEPCSLGHVLTENQHGLIVGACVTEAGTRAEREAALGLLDQGAKGRRRTLGADKQYQEPRFVEALRQRDIVPHVSPSTSGAIGSGTVYEKKNGRARVFSTVRESASWWSRVLLGSNTGRDSDRSSCRAGNGWNGCFRLRLQPTIWSA